MGGQACQEQESSPTAGTPFRSETSDGVFRCCHAFSTVCAVPLESVTANLEKESPMSIPSTCIE